MYVRLDLGVYGSGTSLDVVSFDTRRAYINVGLTGVHLSDCLNCVI